MPLAIGLMSGTSADGIDAALVRFTGKKISVITFKTTPIPSALQKRILAVSPPSSGQQKEVRRLDQKLGELFAGTVIRLCRQARIPLRKINFIGSHGQTIRHEGRKGTLQIGDPQLIAARTGMTTVADFRQADIRAGGEGAPLGPFLHYYLFRHPKRDRAVHNLGGISNLTFIPRGARLDQVTGFDTGPGNMLIDGLTRRFFGRRFDRDGAIASKGVVSLPLLHELMQDGFVAKRPPKSAGREQFGEKFLRRLIRRGRQLKLKERDLVATATAFTAASLAESYRRFTGLPEEIIFGGGGVHNRTLMQMIRAELPGVKISTFEDHRTGISSDSFEAVLFAVLARETLQGRPANLPKVTGARRAVVLGRIISEREERSGRLRGPVPPDDIAPSSQGHSNSRHKDGCKSSHRRRGREYIPDG